MESPRGEAFDAEEAQLALEHVGHVLAPVIVPDGEATGDVLGEAAEALAHSLSDRLQCFEAGATARGVDADAFGAVVVNGNEHRRLTLAGAVASHVEIA
jgi:hypothetical protein